MSDLLPFRMEGDIDHDPLDPHPEVPTPIELVHRLTRPQREQRVERLVELAWARYREAVNVELAGKVIKETCLLYSGGNDSTTIAHIFRPVITRFIHAHTGTGIEATRDFVRQVSADWGIPLVIEHPNEGARYRDFVLGNVWAISRETGERVKPWPAGFPGPAAHGLMYQRLKERGLEKAKHTLGVSGSTTDRLLWIAGRRRPESSRRKTVPAHEAKGSAQWVSPLVVWHKADLLAYRLMHRDVPRNPVTDVLGMSGECGCLANSKGGEAEKWKAAYPDDPFIREIYELEDLIKNRSDIPPHRRRWGWGGDYRNQAGFVEEPTEGDLCGPSCGGDADLLNLMDPLFGLENIA